MDWALSVTKCWGLTRPIGIVPGACLTSLNRSKLWKSSLKFIMKSRCLEKRTMNLWLCWNSWDELVIWQYLFSCRFLKIKFFIYFIFLCKFWRSQVFTLVLRALDGLSCLPSAYFYFNFGDDRVSILGWPITCFEGLAGFRQSSSRMLHVCSPIPS